MKLRHAVVQFLRENYQNLEITQNYQASHLCNVDTLMALFDQQLRNGAYAEQLFCEATAILLRVPILIAPTTSSGRRSYYTLNAAVGGPNMMLANITDNHFQSLIPSNELSSMHLVPTSFPIRNVVSKIPSVRKKPVKRKFHDDNADEPRKKADLRNIRRNQKRTSKKENEVKTLCEMKGIEFINRSEDESDDQWKKRLAALHLKLKRLDKPLQKEKRYRQRLQKKEKDLRKQCENSDVDFIVRAADDNDSKWNKRLDSFKKTLNSETEIPTDTLPTFYHENPKVRSSTERFIEGEDKHDVDTCVVCLETHPVFHPSFDNKKTTVKLNPWKLTDGVCRRCKTDLYNKKALAPRFSGYLTPPEYLPINDNDRIKSNNQHFLPVPPYLQNLSAVEIALISKISVVMNIHTLR